MSEKSTDLGELEQLLRSQIDPVFFESCQRFRPLAHVIKVLSTEVTSSSPTDRLDFVTGSSGIGKINGEGDGEAGIRSSEGAHRYGVGTELGGDTRGGICNAGVSGNSNSDVANRGSWLSVRTLAGKVVEVRGAAWATDTVEDVQQRLTQQYGICFAPSDILVTASPNRTDGSGWPLISLDRRMCHSPAAAPDDAASEINLPSTGGHTLYCGSLALRDGSMRLRKLTKLPRPPSKATLFVKTAAYENLTRQVDVVDGVVEQFLQQHYNSLSSSVHAVGRVSTQFDALTGHVAELREQVCGTKELLTTGMHEQSIKELWERKLEYATTLKMMYSLEKLDKCSKRIDALVRSGRFVAAVAAFNEGKELMYATEMVPVPALVVIRDQILARKSQLLDAIVAQIQQLLFEPPWFSIGWCSGDSIDHPQRSDRQLLPSTPSDEDAFTPFGGNPNIASLSSLFEFQRMCCVLKDVNGSAAGGGGGGGGGGGVGKWVRNDGDDGDGTETMITLPSAPFPGSLLISLSDAPGVAVVSVCNPIAVALAAQRPTSYIEFGEVRVPSYGLEEVVQLEKRHLQEQLQERMSERPYIFRYGCDTRQTLWSQPLDAPRCLPPMALSPSSSSLSSSSTVSSSSSILSSVLLLRPLYRSRFNQPAGIHISSSDEDSSFDHQSHFLPRLQLLLEAAQGLRSLGDVTNYAMERTRDELKGLTTFLRHQIIHESRPKDSKRNAATNFKMNRDDKGLFVYDYISAVLTTEYSTSPVNNGRRIGSPERTGPLADDQVKDRERPPSLDSLDRLQPFLNSVFQAYLAVIARHMRFCELILAIQVVNRDNGDILNSLQVNWMPVRHLWAEMQDELQEILADCLFEPGSSAAASNRVGLQHENQQGVQPEPQLQPHSFGTDLGWAMRSSRVAGKSDNGGSNSGSKLRPLSSGSSRSAKPARFLFGFGASLSSSSFAVTRDKPKVERFEKFVCAESEYLRMRGVLRPLSFDIAAAAIRSLEKWGNTLCSWPSSDLFAATVPTFYPHCARAPVLETKAPTAERNDGRNESLEGARLCEADPAHAATVALPIHRFVETACAVMAFTRAQNNPWSIASLETAEFDQSSGQLDEWLRAFIDETLLPLLRDEALHAVESIVSGSRAFSVDLPSPSIAAPPFRATSTGDFCETNGDEANSETKATNGSWGWRFLHTREVEDTDKAEEERQQYEGSLLHCLPAFARCILLLRFAALPGISSPPNGNCYNSTQRWSPLSPCVVSSVLDEALLVRRMKPKPVLRCVLGVEAVLTTLYDLIEVLPLPWTNGNGVDLFASVGDGLGSDAGGDHDGGGVKEVHESERRLSTWGGGLLAVIIDELVATLLARLKEEGLRLTERTEAAARMSPALLALIRCDPSYARVKQQYAAAVLHEPQLREHRMSIGELSELSMRAASAVSAAGVGEPPVGSSRGKIFAFRDSGEMNPANNACSDFGCMSIMREAEWHSDLWHFGYRRGPFSDENKARTMTSTSPSLPKPAPASSQGANGNTVQFPVEGGYLLMYSSTQDVGNAKLGAVVALAHSCEWLSQRIHYRSERVARIASIGIRREPEISSVRRGVDETPATSPRLSGSAERISSLADELFATVRTDIVLGTFLFMGGLPYSYFKSAPVLRQGGTLSASSPPSANRPSLSFLPHLHSDGSSSDGVLAECLPRRSSIISSSARVGDILHGAASSPRRWRSRLSATKSSSCAPNSQHAAMYKPTSTADVVASGASSVIGICVAALRHQLVAVVKSLSAWAFPAVVSFSLAASILHLAPRLMVHSITCLGSPTAAFSGNDDGKVSNEIGPGALSVHTIDQLLRSSAALAQSWEDVCQTFEAWLPLCRNSQSKPRNNEPRRLTSHIAWAFLIPPKILRNTWSQEWQLGFECATEFVGLLLACQEDLVQHMFIAKGYKRLSMEMYYALWKMAGPKRLVGTDASFHAAWWAANPHPSEAGRPRIGENVELGGERGGGVV